MHILDQPLAEVMRLGSRETIALKNARIETVRDFLMLLPAGFINAAVPDAISSLAPHTHAFVRGTVIKISGKKAFPARTAFTEAAIRDETGTLRAIWFSRAATSRLKQGSTVGLTGKIHQNKRGLFLSNPLISIPAEEQIIQADEQPTTDILTPLYPRIRGISPYAADEWRKEILASLPTNVTDPLPKELRKKFSLPSYAQSIRAAHMPTSAAWAEAARKRFAFEEIFYIQLDRARQKKIREQEPSFVIATPLEKIQELTSRLPFPLTNTQKKCAMHILQDMARAHPMARLLEGDVGSGKTLVAIIATLAVQQAGYQVAYMAPTEILARQHFAAFTNYLRPFHISAGLLTSSESKKFPSKINTENPADVSDRQLLTWAREGTLDILIGTHALIQDKVAFKNLALVIVDEQHRFGVQQRARLRQNARGETPHLLSMTATPIPRTLALTLYGDLSLSLLDEMPPGRKPVITKIVPPDKRNEAYEFIRKLITKNEQAFVVCPKIEDPSSREATEGQSDTRKKKINTAELKSVKAEYKKLAETVFSDFSVAMIHGKLKPKEKEKIIQDFRNKKTHVLVSTSVIEVGMDIPNASVIMIEGADRFGLASLHQFRGRVGRAGQQAYCFLFTETKNQKTMERLQALIKAKNGFELSEYDLQFRGSGELSGTAQWGVSDIGMEALKNIKMVEAAREEARKLIEEDFELTKYPDLQERVARVSEKGIHME
ncbi:MAG: ATP-dependent DNA helicase RecG [Parcubacteria group bacterium Gr01-1014_70]|nr:MAG: ATP-dependent DNA helicase RecG [Parcubacteria group bacterium Gr01-1014_70]